MIAQRSREVEQGGTQIMAAVTINVVEKTPGNHIEYELAKEKITFNDELTVKLSSREKRL